ncbi:MAG TPA: hypothetical protein VGT08_11285 [Terracidiphilus sp.]|nr:hypothetical protein [Terracidiphilus sp.]
MPRLADSWLLITGVVEDAKNDGLRDPVKPAIYTYTLHSVGGTQILVRSQATPLTLLHSVRAQMSAVNPEQQTDSEVEDLDNWISDEPEWQQERLVSWIFGAFAGLAAVGLYSVVSYTVVQRPTSLAFAWHWAHSAHM